MPEIKAIFFDLDDTLVNSKEAEHDASIEFKKLFKEFDGMEDEYFASLWRKLANEQYERYARKEISFERNRINRIIELFSLVGIEKKDDEAKEIFDKYLYFYEKNWKVYGDVIETLDKLKTQYKLGIITNGNGIQQRKKMELTKIRDFFSEIIISGEVGFSKPSREIFEIACSKIKENPEDCLMVGDNFKLDIQGSENAGLNPIWVNRKNEENEYENQVKELKEILGKL